MTVLPALDRRTFLHRLTALGLLALPGPLSATAELASSAAAARDLPRRRLGRTGLRVSTLGLNLAHETPGDVVDFAIDLGINYLDTARRYREGQSERDLAPILARRRDEVLVASKWHRREGAGRAEEVLASLERSLRALRTDHLDVWLTDSVSEAAQVGLGPWLEAAQRAREQGKARFIGLSAWEGDLPAIVGAAADAEIYDVVHVRLVPGDLALMRSAIERANLGVVAMYVLSAARDSAISDIAAPEGRRDAVAWALGDERIACALVETPRLEDVQMYAEGALRAHAAG